jgi:hypothetical protein
VSCTKKNLATLRHRPELELRIFASAYLTCAAIHIYTSIIVTKRISEEARQPVFQKFFKFQSAQNYYIAAWDMFRMGFQFRNQNKNKNKNKNQNRNLFQFLRLKVDKTENA